MTRAIYLGTLLVSAVAVRPTLAQEKAALVTVAPVVNREISSLRTFVGNIAPLRVSTIGSAIDGRVIEFLVNEGERVEAEQPLCRLRTDTLRIELARAKAQLDLSKQELAELQNGSRPEEIAHAKAVMLGAQALRDSVRSKLKRLQALIGIQRSAVTQDELRDAESAAENAEQVYEAAKAQMTMAESGPRREQILQAQARVDIADQTVKEFEDRLEKHTIRAPFGGYVVQEFTEVGQWIAQAEPVVMMVELDQVEIGALVLENYMTHLEVGAPASVEIPALPGKSFEGTVSLIVPFADPQTRQFPVKIRLRNENVAGTPVLKPGMFARVTLPAGEQIQATLIPKDALFINGTRKSVFVIETSSNKDSHGTARQVDVQTGASVKDLIEVRSGLQPGELVAVVGNERLQPGQSVQIVATKETGGVAVAGGPTSSGGPSALSP